MGPNIRHAQADRPRRPARDLIAAVLENMRRNLEPLKYSTLAPSRYVIYLHPAEYARLESILPVLYEQTIRALAEELDTLNRRSIVQRYAERILGNQQPPVESAAGEWHIEFLPDPDGDVAEDAILIDSELRLPPSPELGAGDRTRRITTVHLGQRVTTRHRTSHDTRGTPDPSPLTERTAATPAQAAPILARLTHDDDSGHHAFDIVKDSVTIGRGGITYPVDIKIASSADVSREHARIRRDPQTGRFLLIDLSSLGTTLNGRHVPRGYDEVDGTKRENGVDTPLPDQARIGLADTVYLQFETVVTVRLPPSPLGGFGGPGKPDTTAVAAE
ncbi:MAG TPA: FHA domain-containing protein [Vicinamibacterales bacterium]|nr:FHA domain-containing protein [Vicinamibacterales bacterium]